MEDPQNHFTEWKKETQKGIFYDSIDKSSRTGQTNGWWKKLEQCLSLGGDRLGGAIKDLFVGIGIFYILIGVWVARIHAVVKTYWIVLKIIDFTTCKV